jgi:4-alpha-glucanotransferase
MDELAELARRWRIETSYWDVQGRQQTASPEAVQRIAAALSRSGIEPQPEQAAPAPSVAYQGDGRRTWIIAAQLYSLRSARNWGHGDFSDLAALIGIAADAGASGVGLNPLHALFVDKPEQASPYSPSSRLFLNPLYIDVTAVPESAQCDSGALQPEIDRLRSTELVDYTGVARLKLSALRDAYRVFAASASEERRRDFETFCQERGQALHRYAAFETLRRRFDRVWWEWPEEWRRPDERALSRLMETDADEIGFQKFLQWTADRQLAMCRDLAASRDMSIGLYLDLAVGVDAGGADAWMEQGMFLEELSVGAPPDAYNPDGQNWGLTTFNPHGLAAHQFEPLRAMLRSAMRHAGAIRLDHVLGLMRLYVIPYALTAKDGAYLRFPFHRMLDVIADESRQDECIVIGEDLGTVPEGFRETVADWGLWSYLVVLFEREGDGSFRPPSRYPEKAIATMTTHDLPTFAGWMSGHDLAVKRSIGVDPGETDDDRDRSRTALRHALEHFEGAPDSYERVAAFLANTPTRLVSISIEDVLDLKDQINIPGTVNEHPNWRRRLPVDLEQIGSDQRLRRIAEIFSRAGRSNGGS